MHSHNDVFASRIILRSLIEATRKNYIFRRIFDIFMLLFFEGKM